MKIDIPTKRQVELMVETKFRTSIGQLDNRIDNVYKEIENIKEILRVNNLKND